MKSKPVPLGTTIFKLAFCGLFVAVSGVVSIVAGWLPMWFLSEAVWRRPSLVETRATVSEVELKTRKGSSSSRRLNYSVVARYRFQWQGAEYISTQVTPNVKSSAEQHNTDLFRALKSARIRVRGHCVGGPARSDLCSARQKRTLASVAGRSTGRHHLRRCRSIVWLSVRPHAARSAQR